MTIDEAIEFLRAHQPMPVDWDLTQEELDAYAEVLKTAHDGVLDPRLVDLLIGAFGEDTACGLHESAEGILWTVPPDLLRAPLLEAMESEHVGSRYYAANLAWVA